MKLEIEITEDEIKSAIERKVRSAVADQTNAWGTDAYIKEQVKGHWHNAANALVMEQLSNSTVMREKIRLEIEKKLRAQITAALRLGAKE